jgi:hypothetical protein
MIMGKSYKSPTERAVMVAAGLSLGLAMSFFVVIGKGVMGLLKSIDSLKDHE